MSAPLSAPQRSLAARVATGVLGLLAAGGVIVAIAAFAYGRQAAREAYDRLLLGAAGDIAETVSIIDGAPSVDLPVSAFQLLALAPQDRIAYAVRGSDGGLITGYTLDLPQAAHSATQASFTDGWFGAERARFVTLPRRFAERDFSGTIRVTVGQTLRARNAMALDLTRDALIALTVAGVAMVLLASLVIAQAMRPLARLAEGLEARDPYDLTPMDDHVPTEAAVMVSAMNGFMRRLDRQFDAMRNLISDTAHQLRTPVAALRVQAELIAEEPDADKRGVMIERLLKRSRGLGTLLDQMLSRALVMHRTESAPRHIVDLRDVALDVIEETDLDLLSQEFSRDSDVKLVIGDTPVCVRADALMLGEAAKNLLINAFKHGAPPLRVGAELRGAQAVLWVEDGGQGLPEAVRGQIGARFTRTAASRGDSAGLGLSIVQAVARAFDGDVQFDQTPTGFRASLTLPAALSPALAEAVALGRSPTRGDTA
ncbi:Sensor protein BasS [Aquimixticola soesokkakensis]|uniref:histidine kinase n=1 Tax=Aquimixticola soesokkakensis TaxID=1519096 RepID=A0A1Y5SZY8_9RHOB|nr:sensor histidine kinase [Aquimixticola soesokkakensis]SLN50453.1 Sensor protein BasS [Aquimixticola soesokkakensis]